ncbi:WD40 repeat domain-containing protein [Cohnella yongneupensis]|uniref:WD40 repeat domain-containing protein n=1 Tax=Cohnella yongneupensis TaxID=425006 RepID=A0ABW0QT58_9BACL
MRLVRRFPINALEKGTFKEFIFSSNNWLVASFTRGVMIWNMESKELVRDLGKINSISKNFKYVGQYEKGFNTPSEIKIFELATNRIVYQDLNVHKYAVKNIYFTPDSTRFLIHTYSESIKVFDIQTGQELREFYIIPYSESIESKATQLKFHIGESREYLLCNGNRYTRLYDLSKGELEHAFKHDHSSPARSIAFTKDGATLLTGNDNGDILWWRTKDGLLLKSLKASLYPVNALDVSSVSLAAVGQSFRDDPNVYIYDLEGNEKTSFKAGKQSCSGVRFSPDGKYVAIASDDGIYYCQI